MAISLNNHPDIQPFVSAKWLKVKFERVSAFKTDLVTLHLTASQVPLPVSVIKVLDEHVSVGECVAKLAAGFWVV